jgi:hypothetical protein
MTIEMLRWDDWNEEHIKKHGCAKEDIEFMCSQRVPHFPGLLQGA